MAALRNGESRLLFIAETRTVEVFGFANLSGGDVEYELRRGLAFGEFLVGEYSMVGTLSNGFRFGASEYDLDELPNASVDLVAGLAEGELRVIRRRLLLREREFLESPVEILATRGGYLVGAGGHQTDPTIGLSIDELARASLPEICDKSRSCPAVRPSLS